MLLSIGIAGAAGHHMDIVHLHPGIQGQLAFLSRQAGFRTDIDRSSIIFVDHGHRRACLQKIGQLDAFIGHTVCAALTIALKKSILHFTAHSFQGIGSTHLVQGLHGLRHVFARAYLIAADDSIFGKGVIRADAKVITRLQ